MISESKFEIRNSRIFRAFTLLEVLVALSIFALAAVVLGASYINVLTSYAAVARAGRVDEDLRFARAALWAEVDRETAEQGADFESGDGRRIRWKAEIEPAGVADLFTVTFICELTERESGKTETVTEVFRLLRPTWSEVSERETLRAEARNRILELQGKTAGGSR
jgi:general secretion pathway protein I